MMGRNEEAETTYISSLMLDIREKLTGLEG